LANLSNRKGIIMTFSKNIAALSLAVAILAAAPASACEVAFADISGTSFGSQFSNNTCYVDIVVEKVAFSVPTCRLALRANQEIRIKTALTKSQCPQDEVGVQGRVFSGGSGIYLFQGDIE